MITKISFDRVYHFPVINAMANFKKQRKPKAKDALSIARRMLQAEKNKKRRQTERTKLARRMRWMEKHPDSPITIKFREQAFAEAEIRIEFRQAAEAKQARMLARRLDDSMERFCARFRLEPQHPAEIVAVDEMAAVKHYPTGWKACFKNRRIDANKIAAYLKGEHEMPPWDRAPLVVRLTHSLSRVTGYLVPRDDLHEILGFKVPALALFRTGGDYRAVFVIKTGIIIESAKTWEKILSKLKRKPKHEWERIFEITRTTPEP